MPIVSLDVDVGVAVVVGVGHERRRRQRYLIVSAAATYRGIPIGIFNFCQGLLLQSLLVLMDVTAKCRMPNVVEC